MNFKNIITALLLAATTFTVQATSPVLGEGGLTSPDSIRTQVLDQLEEADICTQKWMDKEARIYFTVDQLGQIKVVDVDTSDLRLKACIIRKLNASQLSIPAQKHVQSYSINVNFRVV